MSNPAIDRLRITQPDDWHLHLRDGEAMVAVLTATAGRFRRAIVMPNLKPPITSVAAAQAYRDRITAARDEAARRAEATGSMAPFATFAVEQTWPEQTAFTHTGGCGHSLAVLHCTHAPMPSQYFEPEHTVSIAEGGFAGTPFEQTSSVHSTPSTGLSPLSATLLVAPFPSHTTFWQSPALCAAVAVPTAV